MKQRAKAALNRAGVLAGHMARTANPLTKAALASEVLRLTGMARREGLSDEETADEGEESEGDDATEASDG